MHGIVRALYESVPGTNIPLEGLLALMKHSVGLRPHPAAEKLGHMAFLTQLLKRHVSAGLADMRGKLSQTELIARGVPIRAAAKRAGARQHTPRHHIAFANNKMSSWHALNPDADFDAAIAARREAIREWSSMDEIAKQEFIDSVKQSELADEDAKMDAEMEADHPAPSVWQRCLASDEWPLKAEHIERLLSTQGTATPGEHYGVHGGGIRGLFKDLRWKAARDMVVEKQGYNPDTGSVLVPLCCREAHPGVCLTRDAARFQKIVVIAADLEHFFTKEWCGRVCRVFPKAAGQSSAGCFVCLGHNRRRRPRIHVTHAFVALHNASNNLRFEGDATDGLEFMSQYGLAKRMIDAMPGLDVVHVEAVVLARSVGVMRIERTLPTAIAWPRPIKPKLPKNHDDLEMVRTAQAAAASVSKPSRPPTKRPAQPSHNNKLLHLIGSLNLDASLNRVVFVQPTAKDDDLDESDEQPESDHDGHEGGLIFCVVRKPHSRSDTHTHTQTHELSAGMVPGGNLSGIVAPDGASPSSGAASSSSGAGPPGSDVVPDIPGNGALHVRGGKYFRQSPHGSVWIHGPPLCSLTD